MFSSPSSQSTGSSAHDDALDRDLIAVMNEARSLEDVESAARTARARSRRRAIESQITRERRSLRRVLAVQFGSGSRRALRGSGR